VIVNTAAFPSAALGIVSNGGSANMTYRNVTAYSTNATGPAFMVLQQDPVMGALSFTAYNLVVANSTAGGAEVRADGHDSSITFSHSNYRSASGTNGGAIQDVAGDTHQIALPMFTNPAGEDFSQLPASPTIDAGVTDPLNGSTDFAGNARTSGGKTDIGAYERPAPAVINDPVKKCKKAKKRKKKTTKQAAASKNKKKKGCKKKKKKKKGR
jgi:hypothetical protein